MKLTPIVDNEADDVTVVSVHPALARSILTLTVDPTTCIYLSHSKLGEALFFQAEDRCDESRRLRVQYRVLALHR